MKRSFSPSCLRIVMMLLICQSVIGGCATIVNGTTQKVSVSSDPPGAQLVVDGESTYTTPATVELSRKRDHLLTISKDGYHTEQIAVQKVISGAVAGNIIAGGLVGWGVDAISGAQYKLVPKTVAVTLRPIGRGGNQQSAESLENALSPAARLRQLSELRDQDLITEEEYEATRKLILEEMRSG